MKMFGKKREKENRFKELYFSSRKTSSHRNVDEFIIQDQITGVCYYQTVMSGMSGADNVATIPLLDKDGRPLVEEVIKEEI